MKQAKFNALNGVASLEQGLKADNALQQRATIAAMLSEVIPMDVTVLSINGYDTEGDLGGWFLATEVENTGTLTPWQVQTNGGSRRWELKVDEASALSFGVKGDGVTDDRDAIYKALLWWKATGRTLRFPAGSYRMASGILLDMAGVAQAGKIIFEGAIKPEPGIGDAITFRNVRGGQFFCRVSGGGQTADYSVADPVGGDTAFKFVNVYGSQIEGYGENYAGRCYRICSDVNNIGPLGFKTQLVHITRMYSNSTAAITAEESTRLAQGVGQLFYIDSGTNAFGTIKNVIWWWEKYGSVIENTTDVAIINAESLWRGVSGFECRGVISFWAINLKLGSELVVNAPDLLRIIPSTVSTNGGAVPRAPQNINIVDVFGTSGNNNFVFTDIGSVSGQGLSISYLNSRSALNDGIQLNNVRKAQIHCESWNDYQGIHLTGACSRIDFIRADTQISKTRGLYIENGADNINFFGGGFSDGNQNAVPNTALVEILSTGSIEFFGALFSSGVNDFLLKLVASNLVKLWGGKMVTGGTTARLSGQPNFAEGVAGLVASARGQVSVSAGSTSVTIPHGLLKAPFWWDAKGNTNESANPTVISDGTNLVATFPSALTGAATIRWKAEIDFAAR